MNSSSQKHKAKYTKEEEMVHALIAGSILFALYLLYFLITQVLF